MFITYMIRPNDINKYLEYPPTDTTFIFIKEKLGCSKTLKRVFRYTIRSIY